MDDRKTWSLLRILQVASAHVSQYRLRNYPISDYPEGVLIDLAVRLHDIFEDTLERAEKKPPNPGASSNIAGDAEGRSHITRHRPSR